MFILLILHGSNFIEQQSGTVVVWNRQNADRSLQKWIYCVVVIIFGRLSFFAQSSRVELVLRCERRTALRCAVASSARAGGGLGEKLVVGAVGCDGRRPGADACRCTTHTRVAADGDCPQRDASSSRPPQPPPPSWLTGPIHQLTLLGPCTWPPSDARVNTFIDTRPELSVWVQFHQTALGNCYGLKLAKCWLQFWNKNK